MVSTIDLAKEYIPAILTLFIVAGCVTLAKHLMLLFGVLAKKRFFMLPWLVITMAGLVSNVFFGVGYSVILATNSRFGVVQSCACDLMFLLDMTFLWSILTSEPKFLAACVAAPCLSSS